MISHTSNFHKQILSIPTIPGRVVIRNSDNQTSRLLVIADADDMDLVELPDNGSTPTDWLPLRLLTHAPQLYVALERIAGFEAAAGVLVREDLIATINELQRIARATIEAIEVCDE